MVHVGFLLKKLTSDEVKTKRIEISQNDIEMFPNPHVLFFLESYGEYYGSHITEDGWITGLEEWFDSLPIKAKDYVILSKYSEGYFLTSTSEIVKTQQNFEYEMDYILSLEPEDILCPNCRYPLEHAGIKEEKYVMKCAKCGFTLVKIRFQQ